MRRLAVVGTVTAILRLLAHDPGSFIVHGGLSRMCAVLTYAARPEGAAWARAEGP
ncbi:hypothetical protein [Streptomyces sp. NPDC088719]|uniref:hypothetical protein n=1 Tax=Streptomyces sp. NPDC088719 TaxID=3365872 RepID=UPI0037F362B1